MFSDSGADDEPSKIIQDERASQEGSSSEGQDFIKEVVAMTSQENAHGILNQKSPTAKGEAESLETNFMKVCDDLQREQSELEA